MLSYSEIKPKKFIVWNDEPYEVLEAKVFRKQQMKPQNVTKLRNLISGKVVENSFHQNEKVAEADINKQEAKYLYQNRGEFWFCEPNNPSNRFQIPTEIISDGFKFVKPNSIISLLYFGDQIIGLEIPIKVELKVVEAPPAIKGNTVSGGTKQVTLETGAVINTPMFINEGEIIRVNTETGEYAERVSG